LVLCNSGWTTHFISDGKNLESICLDLGSTPKSYTLGALGMPGATAYLAFHGKCEPKAGDVVLLTGAAGAVGSLVGQLAKLQVFIEKSVNI
jgi:NADPH-dependent curcumin reductase CurA